MPRRFTYDTAPKTTPQPDNETEQVAADHEVDSNNHEVLQLQSVIGNQNVQRMVDGQAPSARHGLPSLPGVVQAKMTVSPAGDAYEQEADKVASEVMSMSDPVQREGMEEDEELMMKRVQREEMPEEDELMMKRVQREEMPEEDEELMMKRVQREEMPEEDEELMMKRVQREGMEEDEELMMKRVQREEMPEETPAVSSDLEDQITSSQGNGQAMSDGTRTFFESRFGRDFSGVNIHTGGEADSMNQQIQARAFTTGSDIYFREGEYKPNSDDGRELLAHELTHVVQQGAADVNPKYAED